MSAFTGGVGTSTDVRVGKNDMKLQHMLAYGRVMACCAAVGAGWNCYSLSFCEMTPLRLK